MARSVRFSDWIASEEDDEDLPLPRIQYAGKKREQKLSDRAILSDGSKKGVLPSDEYLPSDGVLPSDGEAGDTQGRIGRQSRNVRCNRKGENDKEDGRTDVFERAMSLLALGDHSRRQLREKLEKRGYCREEIENVLQSLSEKRFIDDRRLMDRYAHALAERKLYGAYRIRMEMLRRFDRESVENYFAESIDGIDFAVLAAKSAAAYASKGRVAQIRRLQYLGYTPAQIRRALSDEES